MDTSDPDIQFDEHGICSHCKNYERRARTELFHEPAGQARLQRLIAKIKEGGEGKEYDCVVGVSGGVDSTMAVYTAKQLGLQPLAVHMDNGWDSELAVQNIERALKLLDIDLYTYVVDWEEFRDLHLSFLKASVANSEIPTDHAIVAVLYRVAIQKGIRYIISGGNIVTEAIMPTGWMYDARDLRHIRAIHRKFGTVRLKSYPCFTLFDFAYWTFVKGIRIISILNYVPYVKREAIALLERELGWRNYGGKHYESIYTRFFQAYILPRKFNIDKRRAHLSTLICAGQITRRDALNEMEQNPYPPDKVEEDKEYVLKKLGLTEAEFEVMMSEPVRGYRDYSSNHLIFRKMPTLLNFVKKVATNRV